MKYTAHVLLQYLIQRHKIDVDQIHLEMDQYYSQPHFDIKATHAGRVTQVTLKEGVARPPIVRQRQPLPPGRSVRRVYGSGYGSGYGQKPSNTVVKYKKRRVIR